TFKAAETRELGSKVAGHAPSRQYWSTVATLAGMLQDVGHGPWSHTFEYLALRQDCSDQIELLQGTLRRYVQSVLKANKRIWHEDLSVLYAARMLKDLEESMTVPQGLSYFLPVAMLVNKRMLADLRAPFEQELETVLNSRGILGGMKMLRLLSPII